MAGQQVEVNSDLVDALSEQQRTWVDWGHGRRGLSNLVRKWAMANVTELRVALTVTDFDQALAFYRDVLGLEQMADWSSEAGRVVALDAGRATLELFDEAQAETVDAIEAGRRVSGTVRLAVKVADSDNLARRLVGAGATQVAPPVTTPWGDRNTRIQAPDGMQLTLFTPE